MYVARQPIVDREGRLAAYELLFRSPGKTLDDGVFAAASVANAAVAGQLAGLRGVQAGDLMAVSRSALRWASSLDTGDQARAAA